MLDKKEFSRYNNRSLTTVFIDRLFQVTPCVLCLVSVWLRVAMGDAILFLIA